MTSDKPNGAPRLTGPDPLPDVVFVFGSNTAGRHGKGAALIARQLHGAKTGEGRTGQAYALPTKDNTIRTLPLRQVKANIARFIQYANDSANTEKTEWFLVTRVGCGLAGFADSEIAPLFATAPANCILPPLMGTTSASVRGFRLAGKSRLARPRGTNENNREVAPQAAYGGLLAVEVGAECACVLREGNFRVGDVGLPAFFPF